MSVMDFMRETALEAGALALREQGRLEPGRIHSKASVKDVVTDADLMVEKLVVEGIRDRFPEHDILGEETGASRKGGEYCWAVDPIDGTASYARGTPFFSVSIALMRNGESVAGAVFAPRLDELFLAERGAGAFLNGKKVSVSTRDDLRLAMLGTGFGSFRGGDDDDCLRRFARVVPEVSEVRRCGSAALELAYVACGRYEGFWETGLKLYDVAAGVVLVTEAGGRVSDLLGGGDFPAKGTVASNGLLHDRLLERMTTERPG